MVPNNPVVPASDTQAEPMSVDAMCAVIDRGMAELTRLRRWQNEAVELLSDVSLHLDDTADADQPSGCDYPIPNEAMRLMGRCEGLMEGARVDAHFTLRDQLAASIQKEAVR